MLSVSWTGSTGVMHCANSRLYVTLCQFHPYPSIACPPQFTCIVLSGGLRSAEYATISGSGPLVQHIQFSKLHSLSYMYFTVTHSKTHAHGYQVPIGCARHEVCAVCAMKTYFKIRTCAGTLYASAPLLFVFASGQILTKSVLKGMEHVPNIFI